MTVAITVLIGLSTLVWWSLLIWYTLRAKWWKNPYGRNTFGVSAVLFLVLLRLLLVRLGHIDSDTLGVIVYSLALTFGVQRLIFIERGQRSVVNSERQDNEKETA